MYRIKKLKKHGHGPKGCRAIEREIKSTLPKKAPDMLQIYLYMLLLRNTEEITSRSLNSTLVTNTLTLSRVAYYKAGYSNYKSGTLYTTECMEVSFSLLLQLLISLYFLH
jgi:hypothetical protein